MIIFLEETFIFDIKQTLQNFNVLWPKTCQIFFGKLSACLSKSLSMCLEEVFEDEISCIFLFYKSVQFLSIFFTVFVQKIWILLSKVHSKSLDEKMFLRKLLSSIFFWIFDGILSTGLSWWHFALLHEEFVEYNFS